MLISMISTPTNVNIAIGIFQINSSSMNHNARFVQKRIRDRCNLLPHSSHQFAHSLLNKHLGGNNLKHFSSLLKLHVNSRKPRKLGIHELVKSQLNYQKRCHKHLILGYSVRTVQENSQRRQLQGISHDVRKHGIDQIRRDTRSRRTRDLLALRVHNKVKHINKHYHHEIQTNLHQSPQKDQQ